MHPQFADCYGGVATVQNGQVAYATNNQTESFASLRNGLDLGLRRPYYPDRGPNVGHECVTVNTGQWTVNRGERVPIRRQHRILDLIHNGHLRGPGMQLVNNATAMRKEEWTMLDQAVLRAARLRLRAVADLGAANTYGGFNGMQKMILEHEVMSDPGEAVVDMNALTPGRGDAPQFQLRGLPLPITHCDFWYDSRRLGISQNGGTPLDATMGEAAGRRVAESVEKVTIGVDTGITYGGNSTQVGGYDITSSVYGYLNYPKRITNTTFYRPTGNGRSGTGWSPKDTLQDVLLARNTLLSNRFYGPWVLYTSTDWDPYLDNDYQVFTVGGSNYGGQMTLRERLRRIDGIVDVKRLDFMVPTATPAGEPPYITTTFPFRMVFVQMTADVARLVNGLDITTVQWELKGGLELRFKVLTIQVPQLRSDFYGNCGIEDCQATL